MIALIQSRPSALPLVPACKAIGFNRSTWYAWFKRQSRTV